MKRNYALFTIIMIVAFCTSCGADWDMQKKEGILKSEYIDRRIEVHNAFTGDVEFVYDGQGYVTMRNDAGCMNITILDKKTKQKTDILGTGVYVISVTKED